MPEQIFNKLGLADLQILLDTRKDADALEI